MTGVGSTEQTAVSRPSVAPIWPMPGVEINAKAQRIVLIISAAFIPMFVIGLSLVQAMPPRSATLSADEIARIYTEHQDSAQIGAMILMFGAVAYGIFGAVRIMWVWRLESGRFPVLTGITGFMIAIDATLVTLCFSSYAAVAFRADTRPPEVTLALLDQVSFLLVFPVSPMIVGLAAMAFAVFQDKTKLFPRWLGWVCLFAAVFKIPAGFIGFFKDGPFAWDGLIGNYLIGALYALAAIAMTVCFWKAISKEERLQRATAA